MTPVFYEGCIHCWDFSKMPKAVLKKWTKKEKKEGSLKSYKG